MDAFLEESQHLNIELEEIRSATANFHESKVIGKGGFGKVYKGLLSHSNGQNMVAFKRLDRSYGQGAPEFWKEILMLSHCRHENLISLLGFCDEDGEKILVYEHASHGSLDQHLSSTSLTWRQRLKICVGAAKGLCYLHDPKGTQQRVIHRDIKSSNILLDVNWNAKVSDMGLSKIGPANQQHSFVATNVVGTPGYIDPLYEETYSLTKESDVYSFGVVLFEVLCGRLCFEYKNGQFQSLLSTWEQSYVTKKLDEVIFEDLKQHMDLSSLETFSEIAYQCLHRSRGKRPNMSHVVERLEIALWYQVIFEEGKPPMDYEEICKTVVPPMTYTSEEELRMLLSKGILVNGGKTWFSLNKNGEHCEMIPAAECLIRLDSVFPKHATYRRKKSRFAMDYCEPFCWNFKTHVRTQFLTPRITYTVNLVFSFGDTSIDYLPLSYMLAGETKHSTSYFADRREDGWLMAKLYQFTSDTRNVDLEITFECRSPLTVEGIEFQPVERVEHQVLLEDEEVDMQTISHPDTYWEQKLPSDYEDIIKWSKDTVQWTTKKELHSILCKGFLIKNGEELFSLAKNGKKCHILSARVALREKEWRWRSLPESRFEKVAFDSHGSFSIDCMSRILSPQTTYGSYLVYKLQENHSRFQSPVNVSDGFYHRYIYLLMSLIPLIKRKDNRNTHNLLNRPKDKCFPQQRNDGWMEVLLREFQIGMMTRSILVKLELTFPEYKYFKGLIVKGIEFKPI